MPNTIGRIDPVRALRAGPHGTPPERKPAAEPDAAVRIEAETLATTPPVDAERVAAIRAALTDGTYPLNPAKVADAMIAAGLRLSLGA